MPEQAALPAVDTEPKSGVYIDHDTLELTEAEIVEGNRQGDVVDIEDDDDNGLDGRGGL
jgi:hypothetical protein